MQARMGPVNGISPHPGFIPRIKPFYHLSEKEIATYAFINDLMLVADCPHHKEAFREDIKELLNKLESSNKDRKEIIHTNCFYKKDITNEHIERVIEIFRGIDKLVKKHQRQYRKLLIEPKIPYESL